MLTETITRHEPTIEEWEFAEETGATFDAKTMCHHFNFLNGKSQRYIQAFLAEVERQAMTKAPITWTEF